MAGPGDSWSVLDGHGRTLEVVPTRPAGLVMLVVAGDRGAGGAAGPVGETLPPARLGRPHRVPHPATRLRRPGDLGHRGRRRHVDLALNSGITVLLGTDTDLPAKYEDVAAIIAHASLHGATSST